MGIIERNEDIRPLVDASCRFGHNALGQANLRKQFALLVTTDVHGDRERLASAIEYLNGIAPIDAGICLGDMAPSNFADPHEWYREEVAEAEKPWYTVIGNHDGGNSREGRISATVDEQYDRWIRPNLSKMGGIRPGKTYYAARNEEHKIEIIVLNCHDLPDDKDENGDFLVHRGVIGYSQEQIDWLVSELSAVPEGYTVLAAVHSMADEITLEPSVWTSLQAHDPDSDSNCYAGLIPSIVNAWINGTAYRAICKSPSPSGVYDRFLPALSVNADFTDRGPGIFAGYLGGHYHIDAYGHAKGFPDQKYYSFDTTANDLWQSNGSDLPRNRGTKAEDCVTVVSVDTMTRQVRLVRVGASFTMDMRERRFFVGQY